MNSTEDTKLMSDSRLNTLENEIKHINGDVGEIKDELSDIRQINTSVSRSLERLSVIAEQNQKLEPKIDKLSERISQNEKFIWKVGGAIGLIAMLAPIVTPVFFKAFGW